MSATQGSAPVNPAAQRQLSQGQAVKAKTQTQGVQLLPLLIKYFKIAGLLLLVWVIGYFGFSSSWVMIGLFFFVLNEEYRKVKAGKSSFAADACQCTEKEAICARVDELPSWVYFPDVERAEWLNKILKQMWPYIGEYVKGILKAQIEPIVDNALPNSLKPFKFERTDLGDTPPRIGGVKVYVENVRRDEVIMDLEVFYAGDAEIKVAVRGMNAGIKHLTVHGIVRVVVKPLVPKIPLLGGLNVFFISQPTIDFDLTNFANLLDMPLLSNTLRTVIEDQVAHFMVLPNKLSIPLVQDIDLQALKYPLPQGVLRIHLVAARELLKADIGLLGKGKSDPYCKLYVGSTSFKTRVVENTVNPVWNQYFEAVVDQRFGQMVDIECLDEDPGDDDELGTTSINIESVANTGSMDSWLPLDNVSTGMVHVRALWLHLSKDPDDLDREEAAKVKRHSYDVSVGYTKSYEDSVRTGSEDHLSTALLMVTVDSAKALPLTRKFVMSRSKKTMVEPSPYVRLGVGNDMKKTQPKPKTTDPLWEENVQFLIHNPKVQELYLEVIDCSRKKTKKDKDGKVMDDAKGDKVLGKLSFPIKNLLTAKDLTINRPFQLTGAEPQTKIMLRICLRVLTSEMPAAWALDDHVNCNPAPAQPAQPAQPAAPESPGKASLADSIVSSTSDANRNLQDVRPGDVNDNEKYGMGTGEGDAISNVSSVVESPISALRYRGQQATSPTGALEETAPFGKIQVTIRYSQQRARLIAVIHKCVNLIPLDDDNLSDPYVRIYLMPDHSSTKKKKVPTATLR